MFQQDVSRAVRAALLEDLGDALTTLDQPDASADITAQLIPADRAWAVGSTEDGFELRTGSGIGARVFFAEASRSLDG